MSKKGEEMSYDDAQWKRRLLCAFDIYIFHQHNSRVAFIVNAAINYRNDCIMFFWLRSKWKSNLTFWGLKRKQIYIANVLRHSWHYDTQRKCLKSRNHDTPKLCLFEDKRDKVNKAKAFIFA